MPQASFVPITMKKILSYSSKEQDAMDLKSLELSTLEKDTSPRTERIELEAHAARTVRSATEGGHHLDCPQPSTQTTEVLVDSEAQRGRPYLSMGQFNMSKSKLLSSFAERVRRNSLSKAASRYFPFLNKSIDKEVLPINQVRSNPAITEQVPAITGENHFQCPQHSLLTTEALVEAGGCLVQPQLQSDNTLVDALAQSSGPSLDPSSIQSSMGVQVAEAEHNTGGSQDDTAIDVEALISAQDNPPLSNIDQILGPQMSPPQGPQQNTGSFGNVVGLIFIAWNLFSYAMAGVNNLPGNLTDVLDGIINQSNRIRPLVLLAVCNLFFHTLLGVYYLLGNLQVVHDTYWKAQLIAGVGAPIAVAVISLLSSFCFASDSERWSNWITQLSRVNAAMIVGGPLVFYWMRNWELKTKMSRELVAREA